MSLEFAESEARLRWEGTGTGIVPPNDFTLHEGDEVIISIDGIGTLTNTVGVL